jgi:8-oxo-dGTP diphosphatase
MEVIQFGFKTPGVEYTDRLGVYALILREDGRIGAVENASKSGKLQLPGGGIDLNESGEDALKREVREEMEREVERLSFVGKAKQYVDRTAKPSVNKICSYYLVELIPGNDGHGDKITRWVTRQEFEEHGAPESHKWAVRTFLNSKLK